MPLLVQNTNTKSWQWLAHRPALHPLPGRNSDLRSRFRLAIAVADDEPPCRLDPLDDFRIQGFPRADHLPQLRAAGREVLLYEHSPDGGRSAKRCDRIFLEDLKNRLRAKARQVCSHNAGLGVPRGEERAPGMLCPARRGDVEMQVSRLAAYPVHRRQAANGVAYVGVHDELWLGGCT